LEIQSTDNYIDWTSLSAVFLTGTNWDSRSIPAGGDEPISVATMTFELPIWISAPAKVQRLGVVYKILGSIYDTDGNLSNNLFDDETYLGRRIIAPYGYRVLFVDDKITLLKRSEISINDMAPEATGNWKDLIDHYGELRDGLSEIRLKHHSNDYEVVGHVSYNPLDDSQLIFNIDADTVPTNSLDPVDAIIDPFTVNVDQFDLLSPDIGTRYLILNPIGNSANTEAAIVWGDPEFVANANDIIEYGNSGWSVAFDSQQETSTEYVTNLNTGTQYKWFEGSWSKSVEGLYQEGEWSVVL